MVFLTKDEIFSISSEKRYKLNNRILVAYKMKITFLKTDKTVNFSNFACYIQTRVIITQGMSHEFVLPLSTHGGNLRNS